MEKMVKRKKRNAKVGQRCSVYCLNSLPQYEFIVENMMVKAAILSAFAAFWNSKKKTFSFPVIFVLGEKKSLRRKTKVKF